MEDGVEVVSVKLLISRWNHSEYCPNFAPRQFYQFQMEIPTGHKCNTSRGAFLELKIWFPHTEKPMSPSKYLFPKMKIETVVSREIGVEGEEFVR